MKQFDSAMSIPGIAFGMFCLIAMVVGAVYIISINSQQDPITDTYGNTLSPVSNSSHDLVNNMTSETGGTAMVPLVIIAIVILLIGIIAAIWIASKIH